MAQNHFALVTGGAGFIGSHLVDRLLREGWRVRVLDNFSSGKRSVLKHVIERIDMLEGSLNDPEAVRASMRDVEIVFHLAALGSVTRSMENPAETHENNATGTLRLLVAAVAAGVRRLIYSSSSSVYGDGPGLPRVETQQPQPMSPYAVSKLAGEMYCNVFAKQFDLETVILRYFNVFGPRQDATSTYAAVIPRFIESAWNGRSPIIYGDGTQTRDFTHVDNVVEANLLAATVESAAGKIFNVGSGESISLLEVLDYIMRHVEVTMRPRFEAPRPGDVKNSFANIERAQQELGYEVRVNCFDGLRQMLDASSPIE